MFFVQLIIFIAVNENCNIFLIVKLDLFLVKKTKNYGLRVRRKILKHPRKRIKRMSMLTI